MGLLMNSRRTADDDRQNCCSNHVLHTGEQNAWGDSTICSLSNVQFGTTCAQDGSRYLRRQIDENLNLALKYRWWWWWLKNGSMESATVLACLQSSASEHLFVLFHAR